ncbi:MAG: TatD family hydrolase [Candidatus Gastranaerophilales bacterium]|nr:TatD family hydrolase [Candidatus Gastranaerophilales bacterium]
MLIDTHAHIDFDDYQQDFKKVLQEAKEQGVEKIIIPGVEPSTFGRIIDLVNKYENVYGAIGIHPSDALKWTDESYDEIKSLAKNPKIVAIGEIGLDYYWDKTFIDKQKEIFIKQIEIAKELKKPVIVHDREAHGDTLEILKQTNAKEVGVVMHCFSGSTEFAQECIKEGFYVAFGGVITFKNAKKAKNAAQVVPLEKLLLETDSPFLTPEPYRGKTNHPKYVRIIAEAISELKGVDFKDIESATTLNAQKLFRI